MFAVLLFRNMKKTGSPLSESLLVYAGILLKSENFSWSTTKAHNTDLRRNGGGHALSLGLKSRENLIDHN
jgi:hypothetical protein